MESAEGLKGWNMTRHPFEKSTLMLERKMNGRAGVVLEETNEEMVAGCRREMVEMWMRWGSRGDKEVFIDEGTWASPFIRYGLRCFHVEWLSQRPHGPQSLKYLLGGSLQKKVCPP